MAWSKDYTIDITHNNMDISIPFEDFETFMCKHINFDIIVDVYEDDIDARHESQCNECDEKCDQDVCGFVRDSNIYKEKYDESIQMDTVEETSKDIVHEYQKLNTTLPVEIIKELGKDEVYRIIKGLDWHV